MRRNRRWAIGLPLVALVAAGCAPSAPTQSTGDPRGTWGTVADGQPYLQLSDDGMLLGQDGCNSLGGSWSQSDPDSVVLFEDVLMTLMMCPSADQWLNQGHSAVVLGDLLFVRNENGEVIGRLRRS